MQSPLLNLPILPKGAVINDDGIINFKKNNSDRHRFKQERRRKIRHQTAWHESKHHGLLIGSGDEKTLDLGMVNFFSVEIADPAGVLERLAREEMFFANARTPKELEDFAPETVVGIGQYKYGRSVGYVLVYNEEKKGLGFPGGRVRLGQSPEARLIIEVDEETALRCIVLGTPVSQLKLGEDEHVFLAYAVEYTGGIPQARPTKEEPIVAIIFVDEATLLKACQTDSLIEVGDIGALPVLRSHRRVFLDYITVRDGSNKEVANV
ncbi:MAG: hypothetical protein AAB784_00805 [Patescibacteria group bacterium]